MENENPVGSPDTRAKGRRILGKPGRTLLATNVKFFSGVILGLLVYYLPDIIEITAFETLSDAGRATLGILVCAAFLWISEAIPAFAVGVLVIAAEIAILGKPGGIYAAPGDTKAWTEFVAAWSSSIMWLFLGGFVLAQAAMKTGLDKWMAGNIIRVFGKSPTMLLGATMTATFIFSMFMSNTATAAMMITVAAPVLAVFPKGHTFGRAFILSVPVAANLGGIGTIIGTPPNAIAVGSMAESVRPDFVEWMWYGLPPALFLGVVAFFFLLRKGKKDGLDFKLPSMDAATETSTAREKIQIVIVASVFTLTVFLWMTESIFHIPASVVSFIPIAAFSVTGVLVSKDMRKLPWDVLLLLAGGISLGGAVKSTGLAAWIGSLVPSTLPFIGIVIAMAIVGVVIGNLMSHTAASSILVPVGIGLIASYGTSAQPMLAVPLAIACSCAMCLPISTPPNAVALASGKIESRDFLSIGLIMAVLGPTVAILWLQLVM